MDRLLAQAASGTIELWMNMINAGEVYYRLAKRHGAGAAEQFLADLEASLPVRSVAPDRALILNAARLKSRHAISYADAFAAVTALENQAALVTGNRELRAVKELKLDWIGPKPTS